MPTKDKEVHRLNVSDWRKRLKETGYERKEFWVHKDWDKKVENIGKYIYVRKRIKDENNA